MDSVYDSDIETLGGNELIKSLQVYDTIHDFGGVFPGVSLANGFNSENGQIAKLIEGTYINTRDGRPVSTNNKLKEHMKGYYNNPTIRIEPGVTYEQFSNTIGETWSLNKFMTLVFGFQSIYKVAGSTEREKYIDHGTALIVRQILTNLFPRWSTSSGKTSNSTSILNDRLACIIDTSVLSFPLLFYNDSGHTNDNFIHLIDETNRWDMASTKWNDTQRERCSGDLSVYRPSSEYVYIQPAGAVASRVKVGYNNVQFNLFSNSLPPTLQDETKSFFGYRYYIIPYKAEYRASWNVCEVPSFSTMGIRIISANNNWCNSYAILYKKGDNNERSNMVIIEKGESIGTNALNIENIKSMINAPNNPNTRTFAMILERIGVSIGEMAVALYDLKRSGDWSQVHSAYLSRKRGNNVVFVTIDRLAYVYAVIRNVPAILVTSILDRASDGSTSTDTDESRHNAYALKCFIPDLGQITDKNSLKKGIIRRIVESELMIRDYMDSTSENINLFTDYYQKLSEEAAKPGQRDTVNAYNELLRIVYSNYETMKNALDTLKISMNTKLNNMFTSLRREDIPIDDKYDTIVSSIRVKDRYDTKDGIIPVYSYKYSVQMTRRQIISTMDKMAFKTHVYNFIYLVESFSDYLQTIDIIIDESIKDTIYNSINAITVEYTRYNMIVRGGSRSMMRVVPIRRRLGQNRNISKRTSMPGMRQQKYAESVADEYKTMSSMKPLMGYTQLSPEAERYSVMRKTKTRAPMIRFDSELDVKTTNRFNKAFRQINKKTGSSMSNWYKLLFNIYSQSKLPANTVQIIEELENMVQSTDVFIQISEKFRGYRNFLFASLPKITDASIMKSTSVIDEPEQVQLLRMYLVLYMKYISYYLMHYESAYTASDAYTQPMYYSNTMDVAGGSRQDNKKRVIRRYSRKSNRTSKRNRV